VSSLVLWRGVIADRVGRGRFRSLRDVVPLAFVLAALLAFTAAAAGPVMGAAASEPRRLAIVLDRSATMNARLPDGRTHLDAAKAFAAEAIKKLAPRDEVTVWSATATPSVLVDPTTDAAAAAKALTAVTGTLEPSGLATTTRLARSAAPGLAKRKWAVLVLTDAVGAPAVNGPLVAEGVHVGIVDGGTSPRNDAIVACDLDPADPERLLVRVAITDGAPGKRSLVLGERRVPLDFALNQGAITTIPLGDVATKGGLVEVRLDPPDDFPEDDAARLVVPAAKPLAVAVVAQTPSPFLVQALRAMPSVVDPKRTTLVQPGAPASAFEGADVVIADGVAAPTDRPVLSFGGAGRALERPLLWGVGAHPILAGVDLAPLRIESAVRVEAAPGDATIVACAAGAVGVAGESRGVRHVTLGFRADATTLPLEPAFPLLVRNALRWLARPSGAPRYVVAGEPMPDTDGEVVPTPAPGGPYSIRTRSGAETTIRWIAPAGFRLSPEKVIVGRTPGADAAVAALVDRHLDADTRERFGPRLAALGAALLAAGALFLRRRAPAPTSVPPATGTAWAASTREAATSSRS
jgi:hypothetical protein